MRRCIAQRLMWHSGRVFDDGESKGYDGAQERASAFLRWLDEAPQWNAYDKTADLGRRDPRELSDAGLQAAYSDWLAQESAQYQREASAEQAKFDAEMADD